MLIYTLAGVEKNNDDARKIIQRKSNHTDDPAEILRAEFRINALKHRERKPRKYTKKYSEYWQTNIKEKRKARKRISYDKVPEVLLNEAPPVIAEPPPQQNNRRKRKLTVYSRKGGKNAKRTKKQ